MEVSTFELLFKPQAPAPAAGVAVDRVIQGYFLTITNLESQPYQYRVQFVITPPPAGTPNQQFRTLAGNTLTFVDTGGGDNQAGVMNGTLASSTFTPSSGNILIPANGTALLAVLPAVFPSPLDPSPLAAPTFEVRGYVRITLPALRAGNFLSFQAQSANPVRVLLTPQQRATFLSADNTIMGQVQATLPTASGAAVAAITPDPSFTITFPITIPGALPDIGRLGRFADMLAMLPEEDRAAMVIGAISQIDRDPDSLRALNDALKQVDVPLAVERRNRQA